MNLCRLSEIANIEISGVDKKTVDGETPVRLCNFVDVYRNWAISQKLSEGFRKLRWKELSDIPNRYQLPENWE